MFDTCSSPTESLVHSVTWEAFARSPEYTGAGVQEVATAPALWPAHFFCAAGKLVYGPLISVCQIPFSGSEESSAGSIVTCFRRTAWTSSKCIRGCPVQHTSRCGYSKKGRPFLSLPRSHLFQPRAEASDRASASIEHLSESFLPVFAP